MTNTGRDDLISRKAAKEKFNDIPHEERKVKNEMPEMSKRKY